MTISIWISLLAIIISSGSLALQLKKWLEEGPRLHLSLMADAQTFPDDDGRHKLILTVINRGNAPTILTHMIAFTFDSRWKKFRNKPSMTGIVNTPAQVIPWSLGINATFQGSMAYDAALEKARSEKRLYVGVFSSHSDKSFLIAVPPPVRVVKLTPIGA